GSVCLALAALSQFGSLAIGQDRGPLAQRLDRFRRSLVGEEETPTQHVHKHTATKSSPPRLTSQSAQQAQPTDAGAAKSSATSSSSRANSSRRTALRSQPEEGHLAPANEPTLADRQPASDSANPADDERLSLDEEESPDDAPQTLPEESQPAKVIKTEKKTQAEHDDHAAMLFTRTTPRITLRATGPKRLDVGQAAEFKLLVINEGDQAANDLVVMVSMPESAELTSARPTSGTVDRAATGSALQWAIRKLASGKREELSVRIVPHDSAPIDLDVRCGCAGIVAKSTLDVQQAKLALAINGASEVMCGEKEIYRLTVNNSGNGPAENTVIHLLPLPPDEGAPATHRIGTLGAG
ncbi:MAG: hypothetical protein ACREHD_26525, partial [Pirellulales bacterium]